MSAFPRTIDEQTAQALERIAKLLEKALLPYGVPMMEEQRQRARRERIATAIMQGLMRSATVRDLSRGEIQGRLTEEEMANFAQIAALGAAALLNTLDAPAGGEA